MATTPQRLEHPSFSTSAASARRPSVDAGARWRLILALAGFAALVAWGLADQSDDQRSGTDRLGASSATADQQQAYDGRGKWGGYLPQERSRPEVLRDAGVTQQR